MSQTPFQNPSWVPSHLTSRLIPQRNTHPPLPAPTPTPPEWHCDDCSQDLPTVFDAGDHQIRTSHANIRELSEREKLVRKEELCRAELEFLRRVVPGGEIRIPGLEGLGREGVGERRPRAPTPIFTPSTIPGLGPVSGANQAYGEANEVVQLRFKTRYLELQLTNLKTKIWSRIEALEHEIEVLKAEGKMRDLKLRLLAKERDELRVELDGLKNGNSRANLGGEGSAGGGEKVGGEGEVNWEDLDLDLDLDLEFDE
jgi:hypothetical protein